MFRRKKNSEIFFFDLEIFGFLRFKDFESLRRERPLIVGQDFGKIQNLPSQKIYFWKKYFFSFSLEHELTYCWVKYFSVAFEYIENIYSTLSSCTKNYSFLIIYSQKILTVARIWHDSPMYFKVVGRQLPVVNTGNLKGYWKMISSLFFILLKISKHAPQGCARAPQGVPIAREIKGYERDDYIFKTCAGPHNGI